MTPRPAPMQFALALALPVRARAACAQRVPVELAWDAPAARCPDVAYVRDGIARRLGRAAETDARQWLRVHATVHDEGAEGFSLRIETASPGGTGERTLHADGCTELADAAALAIALAIDPEAVAHTRTHAVAPAPVPTPVPAPTPAAHRDAPVTAHRSLRSALRVVGAFDAGTLPAPTAGLGLAGGVELGLLRLELAANYWFAQSSAATTGARGAVVFLVEGAARACLGWTVSRFVLGPCVAIHAGSMHGDALGVTDPTPGGNGGLWLAAVGGLAAALNVSQRFALRLDAGVRATIVAPGFTARRSPHSSPTRRPASGVTTAPRARAP